MKNTKKSAKEKLCADHGLPRVVDIPKRLQSRFGKGKLLIPKPLDVDALIKKVKRGKLITQSQIRDKLAKEFKADVCCPMTTGIFIRLSAESAQEELISGKKNITPYWRVIKDDGSLNDKFPGGVEEQGRRLEEEGHKLIVKRGKTKVLNFEKSLMKL